MICFELTISKKKWSCLRIYQSPTYSNLETFFNGLTNSLAKISQKYENYLAMEDFNRYRCTPRAGKDEKRCNLFNLTNLVKEIMLYYKS